jgi:hypothetical protein
MPKEKLLLSFSGGRTSAFMTQWCLSNLKDRYDMMVVFANTGKERQATLEFIRQCDEYFNFNCVWVEGVVNREKGKGMRARVVSFESASRLGEPFEAAIQKFGLPNQKNPYCTRDLKGGTIKAYLKSIGWKKYYTAIGIRNDERHRIDFDAARRHRVLYPLVTMVPTTKSDVNLYWSKMPFDLELKSYEGNCDLCWKKSTRKLLTLIQENPGIESWWDEMERLYQYYRYDTNAFDTTLEPIRMFRGRLSVADLVDKSKQPFSPSEDESKDVDRWRQMTFMEMVEAFDPELDVQDDGCAESCEAFQFS